MAEEWPSPHHHEAHPLPRVEDLPAAWEGYDRERVQAAFDAFYRHIAQLDATLRTLEAVEVFRGEASDLRAELSLRMRALALPFLLLLKKAHVFAATSRTDNAVRPSSRNKIFKTILSLGKVEDCFLQSVWAVSFALHREMNLPWAS